MAVQSDSTNNHFLRSYKFFKLKFFPIMIRPILFFNIFTVVHLINMMKLMISDKISPKKCSNIPYTNRHWQLLHFMFKGVFY